MSWNIIAPASGRYAFQVETTSGGKVDVRVDEHQVVVQGQTGGKLENREGVFLTKGMHNLRARASGGAFELVGIACANPGQPYGISGLAGQSAYRSVILKWPAGR